MGRHALIGAYEQDGDASNGREPIEWLVLDTRDGMTLLITRYAIDYRQLHGAEDSVSWANCDLRAWLNEEFLEGAFTDLERETFFLAQTGAETQDYCFLLSTEEAGRYFAGAAKAVVQPTAYAQSQYRGTSDSKNAVWWLRSPAATRNGQQGYATVSTNGTVNGTQRSDGWYYVRPAI